MQVSQIVKQNLFIDSKTYSNLSPNMKDAVKDVNKKSLIIALIIILKETLFIDLRNK